MLFGNLDSPYMRRAFYSNGENKAMWQQNFGAMLTTDQGKVNLLSARNSSWPSARKRDVDALMADAVYTNSIEGKYEHINADAPLKSSTWPNCTKTSPTGRSVSDREVKASTMLTKV